MEFLPDILQGFWLGKPIWAWLGFLLIIGALMIFDLGVMNKVGKDAIGLKDSMRMCVFYTGVGIAFAAVIYWLYGPHIQVTLQDLLTEDDAGDRGMRAAMLYLTGYFVEMSLSMDNVFVISLIFGYFQVPRQYQHRALFWGIIGVIVLRALLIGFGVAMVSHFHWMMTVFGLFLVFAGTKMLLAKTDSAPDVGRNPILKFVRKHYPVSTEFHGAKFFVRQRVGKSQKVITQMTPLFLALVMVELADVVFAVDSVPAIFAITPDPFLVYTSNIFAIIGLRALYFTLAALVHRFEYLKFSLALILVIIGGKILLNTLFLIQFPDWLPLLITLGLLAGGIIYSMVQTGKAARKAKP